MITPSNNISIVECPRDAMQGWSHFIPTEKKIEYLNSLLKVGFDTLDFGSFVSPRAIPQMADTAAVLKGLDLRDTSTKLLAIVANLKGAVMASAFDEITYLGYPFSLSETFQQRNTNASIGLAFEQVKQMQEICLSSSKKLVVYFSMGFGNPYGDPYEASIVFDWADQMKSIGVEIISVADTVGLATAEQVGSVMHHLIDSLPNLQFGVHLHSTHQNRKEKIKAALDAGCTRFDGALKGIGGCPMAGSELVGNMDTEWMIRYLESLGYTFTQDHKALEKSIQLAAEIFL